MAALRPLLVVLLCLLAFTLAGCGGGGGGGGGAPAGSTALLDDPYFLWLVAGELGAPMTPDTGENVWGALTADGMGGLMGSVTVNEDAAVTGPTGVLGTYTVAASRETTYVLGGSNGYAGWTNASGTLSLAGAGMGTSKATALGLVKLGAGQTNANLQGDYHVGMFGVPTDTAIAYWGSASFTGMGTGTITLDGANADSMVVAGPPPVAATYSVAADGQFTMTFGGTDFAGALGPDGDVVLGTGATNNGTPPISFAFVRKTSGASAATLSGTYQIVGLEREGGGFSSLYGSVVSDGMGSLTATFTKNTNGTISTSGPDIVAYTAGADGALTIDPTGEPIKGGFSAGGTYVVVSGPDAAANPRFYVLMRR